MFMTFGFGLFGLIVGSFLNVVVLRHGARTLGGRSACMSCGREIAWFDLVPVFSWLALRGRCRHCGSSISVQYLLVEAATATLFGLIGAAPFFDVFYKLLFCVIGAILIAIAAYDIRHTIIPDAWVYTFDVAAFFVMGPLMFLGPSISTSWLVYVLAGPLAALPLFALWFVSGGRWMGFGDVKLALGIGWLLGPLYGIGAIFFAFIIGGLFSTPLLIVSSQWWRGLVRRFTPTSTSEKSAAGFTMKSEVPFGPFLICSCVLFWMLIVRGIDPVALVVPLL
jgi:leader peptidase (prepilin peptidase)/N-methyltransferase